MTQTATKLPLFWRNLASRESALPVRSFFEVYQFLLEEKQTRAAFLEGIPDINNLVETYTYGIKELTVYNLDDANFQALSSAQKDSLRTYVENYFDHNNRLYVPGVVSVNDIVDSVYLPDVSLSSGVDFTKVSDGVFEFTINIFDVDGKLPKQSESVIIPLDNTSISLIKATLYFLEVTVSEDWYFKRIGTLLNLDEGTNPEIVLAMYRMRIDGIGYKTLDAFFQACNDIPIALKDELVTSVSGTTVYTESTSYTLPAGSEIIVRAGQRVKVGDPFIHVIYMVDQNVLDHWWLHDPFKISSLNSSIYKYTPQSDLSIPIMIYDGDSPFWFGFPNLPLFLMEYYTGGDPDVGEITFTGTGTDNLKQYSNFIEMDATTTTGITVKVEIDSVSTGSITGFADSATSPGLKTTATTSAPHGLSDGDYIEITAGGDYNGIYTISNSTASTFDIEIEFSVTTTATWDFATFKWSIDNGATWEATTVQITGGVQELDYGLAINIATIDGHVLADDWVYTVSQNWVTGGTFTTSGSDAFVNLASATWDDDGVEVDDIVYFMDNVTYIIYKTRVLEVMSNTSIKVRKIVDPATPDTGPVQYITWPGSGTSIRLKIFKTFDDNMYDSIYGIRFVPIDKIMEVLAMHYVRVFVDTNYVTESTMVSTYLPLIKKYIPLWTYIEYNYVANATPYKEALRNEGII